MNNEVRISMIKTSRRNNIMEKTEFTQARKKTELFIHAGNDDERSRSSGREEK